MRVVEGGCSCGVVRFRVQGEPLFVSYCHCDNCRRAHGAGAVEWAGYEEASLQLLGKSDEDLALWLTPTGASRRFCRSCGSPLFFSAPRWPGEIHIAVAALEADPGKLPSARVYADRPPAWLPVPQDDLPHLGGEDGVSPL